MMRVFGLDFTGAPSTDEPITCAACSLEGDRLWLDAFAAFHSFELFDNFLHCDGPWIAAVGFPFGQPERMVRELGWPGRWADYVTLVAGLELDAFEALIRRYRDERAPHGPQPVRDTDIVAGARDLVALGPDSPDRMFFHGAPKLLTSGASVLPCRPATTDRIVVEALPALVARALVGRRGYKSGAECEQTSAEHAARSAIVQALGSSRSSQVYGLRLELPGAVVDDVVSDPGADSLDALMCAVQAAWAWRHRDAGHEIARTAHADEGCIADPATVTREPVAAET